jgi:hypothetical protein
MKNVIMILCILTLSGCAHHVAKARQLAYGADGKAGFVMSDQACQKLMEKRDRTLAASKVFVGLGGASALTTPVPALKDNPNATWGVAAGAATFSVIGGALLWYGERKNDEFEEGCEVEQ